MTTVDKIKALQAELEEARNWCEVSRGAEWAEEWYEDVELQLSKVQEVVDREEPAKPITPLKVVRLGLGDYMAFFKIWVFWDHNRQQYFARQAPQEKPIREWSKAAKRVLGLGLSSIALLLACNASAWAVVDEAKAVHAILGEARGESYKGMYAVACAIRNRGHLRGVYGAKADVSDASDETIQLAYKAWHESEEGEDITSGADHWENVNAFGMPYWAKGRKPTLILGNHRFYRVNS